MIKRASVGQKQQGLRLDETLTQLFAEISRSEARRIIDRGGCSVNSAMARIASRKACFGDAIEIGIMEKGRFKELILPPQALLYEDDDLVALDKPAGVNSQRTPYQLRGTMEFWVSEYFRSEGVTEPARIVHRLDRGTSGAMVFPKHKRAAAWLSNAFHDGMIEKAYFAIVCGRPAEEAWVIDAPIGKIASGRYGVVAGGKSAVTRFRLLFCCNGFSLVEAYPETGRTHQIRVHLEASGMPILGDRVYGGASASRMMLHCLSLTFASPDKRKVSILAPPPVEIISCLGGIEVSQLMQRAEFPAVFQ